MKFSENGNQRLTFCHWFKVSDITVAVGLVGSVSVFPLGQKIACSFNSDFLAKIPIIGVSVAEISECAPLHEISVPCE